MILRPYQRAALDALYAYWGNQGGNPIIVLPGGAGKSLVMGKGCQELVESYPTIRIGIFTHVQELILQDYQELIKVWPTAPIGIYSAGVGRRDMRTQILVGGIQSVYNKVRELGGFDILFIDEVQLVSEEQNTMYGKFIADLKLLTPDMRICGLSATPFRMDSGSLVRGKNRRFDKIVYEAPLGELIEQGYLAPLISKATQTMFDVSGVKKRGGEFIPGQLEVAVDKEWVTKSAAQEIVQFGQNRTRWLLFCSGIQHAFHMRDAIRALGFSCETVSSKTPKQERRKFIQQFRDGIIRGLTNVGILGVGTNVPGLDLIGLLRPTESAGLFYQQVVRGTRLYPGKENCLVLDFSGNTARHGPVDTITAKSASKKSEDRLEPLCKTCPNCGSLIALATQICPDCGHQFPLRDELPKHEATADATTSILSKGAAQWVDVDSVKYYRHEKPGSPASLRAEYQCGFVTHKEWICLSHSGLARSKAEAWWQRVTGTAIPRTTDEALARVKEIRCPVQIQVRPDGKYFSVVGRKFEAVKEAAE